MAEKQEKKPEGLRKARRTAAEKERQAYRTLANKARRQKQRDKFLAKRRAALKARPDAAGKSALKNREYRELASVHPIRTIVTVNGEVTVVRVPSVGNAKRELGIPTKWQPTA